MATHTVAAIGEDALIRGLSLIGVQTIPAEDAPAVAAAWRALPPEVGVVLVTSAAAAALADEVSASTWPLVAVVPG
jgi:vacuolar-type H+-ATPase subunit F/Vma7